MSDQRAAMTPLLATGLELQAINRDDEAGVHMTWEQKAQRILDALAALETPRVLLGDRLYQAGNTG